MPLQQAGQTKLLELTSSTQNLCGYPVDVPLQQAGQPKLLELTSSTQRSCDYQVDVPLQQAGQSKLLELTSRKPTERKALHHSHFYHVRQMARWV
jgi:hypothetical protein